MAHAAAGKTRNRREPRLRRRSRGSLCFCRAGARSAPIRAGVYQALAEANVLPTWIAGISIGAVNSAIIAGNPPENRVARLREFWEAVSTSPLGAFGIPIRRSVNLKDNATHRLVNQFQALGDRAARRAVVFRPPLSAAAHLRAAATETTQLL